MSLLDRNRKPFVLQFRAQPSVVVDFAVEHDPKRSVHGPHRLSAGRAQIDNRQPPMGQTDALVSRHPQAGAVGPAANHRVARLNHLLGVQQLYLRHDTRKLQPTRTFSSLSPLHHIRKHVDDLRTPSGHISLH